LHVVAEVGQELALGLGDRDPVEGVLPLALAEGEVLEEDVDGRADHGERFGAGRIDRDTDVPSDRRPGERVDDVVERRDAVEVADDLALAVLACAHGRCSARYARASCSVAKASPRTPVPLRNIVMMRATSG